MTRFMVPPNVAFSALEDDDQMYPNLALERYMRMLCGNRKGFQALCFTQRREHPYKSFPGVTELGFSGALERWAKVSCAVPGLPLLQRFSISVIEGWAFFFLIIQL